jgi:hypothetical protein
MRAVRPPRAARPAPRGWPRARTSQAPPVAPEGAARAGVSRDATREPQGSVAAARPEPGRMALHAGARPEPGRTASSVRARPEPGRMASPVRARPVAAPMVQRVGEQSARWAEEQREAQRPALVAGPPRARNRAVTARPGPGGGSDQRERRELQRCPQDGTRHCRVGARLRACRRTDLGAVTRVVAPEAAPAVRSRRAEPREARARSVSAAAEARRRGTWSPAPRGATRAGRSPAAGASRRTLRARRGCLRPPCRWRSTLAHAPS